MEINYLSKIKSIYELLPQAHNLELMGMDKITVIHEGREFVIPVEVGPEYITAYIDGQPVRYTPDRNDQLQAQGQGDLPEGLIDEVGRILLKGV